MQVPCPTAHLCIFYFLPGPAKLFIYVLSLGKSCSFLRILLILYHSILPIRPLIDICWISKWMPLSKIFSPCIYWLVHPKNDWEWELITLVNRVISIWKNFVGVCYVHIYLFTYDFTTSSILKKINHLARFQTAQESVGETIILFSVTQWFDIKMFRK